MIDDGAARKKLPGPGFYETHERLFGWKCFYCREMTKEPKCPKCDRPKEEAQI